jgi:hypothetical protein
MPRISCPKHKDCYVDCPGSGYAYYVEPYGPCTSGCDQAEAGDALAALIREATADVKFYGAIVGLTTGVLANFAREIVDHVPDSARAYLQRLQNLDILEDTRRFNVQWEDADVHSVILAFVSAASGGRAQAA